MRVRGYDDGGGGAGGGNGVNGEMVGCLILQCIHEGSAIMVPVNMR